MTGGLEKKTGERARGGAATPRSLFITHHRHRSHSDRREESVPSFHAIYHTPVADNLG